MRALVVATLAALAGSAEAQVYPTPAQLKLVRSAVLYLSPDGAFAKLDPVEWCEEVQLFLKEHGYRNVSRRHYQVVNEVAVVLPSVGFRVAAKEIVRVLSSAPAPLSRFQARFEVRRFDNTQLTARYEGEKWKEARESKPDPVPFTVTLAPGQWMMSVEHVDGPGLRIALWDKEGEANPYEVQAIVALPDGSIQRSRKIPWNPAGIEVHLPSDFPSLQGKRLPSGTYRVIFEADGRTIDWPRSLSARL